MNKLPGPQWFLMPEVRRRRLSTAVWVPLRQSETLHHEGEDGKVGERHRRRERVEVEFPGRSQLVTERLHLLKRQNKTLLNKIEENKRKQKRKILQTRQKESGREEVGKKFKPLQGVVQLVTIPFF